ncbi:hypothetical protein H2203_005946 [Taxawa tesnikishii (nom. ined.)]|nr:hypothetical protein H2203_005946 [Dothideales sp. JES 119]
MATKAQDIYLAGYSRVLTEPNAFGYGPDPATTTKTNIRKHTMTPADPDYNEEESIYDTRPHKWIFPQVPKPHNEPLLRPKKAKKEGEETMDPAALNAAYRAGYSATRPCPGDWIRDEATGHCYPPDANAATDSTGATAADWSLLALWAAIIASAIYASSILLRSPQNQPAGLPPTPYPGYRRPSSEPEDPPSLPNRFLQWLWALICGLLLSPFRFVGFSIRVARDTALAVIDAIRAWFHPYVEVARYHPLRDSLARFTWRFRRALVGWKLWSVIMGLAYVLLLLDQRKGAKHVVAVRRSATTSGTWHYWPGSALNRKWDGSNSHYDKSKWERDDSSLDALGRVERIVGGRQTRRIARRWWRPSSSLSLRARSPRL